MVKVKMQPPKSVNKLWLLIGVVFLSGIVQLLIFLGAYARQEQQHQESITIQHSLIQESMRLSLLIRNANHELYKAAMFHSEGSQDSVEWRQSILSLIEQATRSLQSIRASGLLTGEALGITEFLDRSIGAYQTVVTDTLSSLATNSGQTAVNLQTVDLKFGTIANALDSLSNLAAERERASEAVAQSSATVTKVILIVAEALTVVTLAFFITLLVRAISRPLERTVQEHFRELSKTQRNLLRSEKLSALGTLVTGIAHELTTPIGNVVTLSSFLKNQSRDLAMELGSPKGVSRAALATKIASVEETAQLIEQIIHDTVTLLNNFKEVASAHSSGKPDHFVLRRLVETLVKTHQPEIAGRNIAIEIKIPPSIHLHSYPNSLFLVLDNLMRNSIDHAFIKKEAGTISIQAYEDDSQIVISYSDDGGGLSIDSQLHLFEPFFTTRKQEGHIGLGLHIVHSHVENVLGGTMDTDTSERRGTSFQIRLPRVAPSL